MWKDKLTIEDWLEFVPGKRGALLRDLWRKGDSPVEIKGHFEARCTERGKYVPGTKREGFNVCTLTGREYVVQMVSYKDDPLNPGNKIAIRNDRLMYIGVGRGAYPETSSVDKLSEPVAYNPEGDFLAPWSMPTFPAVSIVRYARSYTEFEISIQGTVPITEAGMFTDGNPATGYQTFRAPADLQLVPAGTQPPMFYKAFEVLKKTQNFVLETAWEVRL